MDEKNKKLTAIEGALTTKLAEANKAGTHKASVAASLDYFVKKLMPKVQAKEKEVGDHSAFMQAANLYVKKEAHKKSGKKKGKGGKKAVPKN